MYLTKKEIFSQYDALKKTFDYLKGRREEIKKTLTNLSYKSITFIGSGSSYCLAQSGEISTKVHIGIPANSLAAGDLMLNYSHYRKMIKDTLFIAPSRSGSTSEVFEALKKTKEEFDTPFILISAKKDSKLSSLADIDLCLPWAFDESVCQTRTVTNLYMAQLFLIGINSANEQLLAEIYKAVEEGKSYLEQYKKKLKEIGKDENWEKVVVLGDSELQGIADEASIAFKEIPQISSNYHHLLDVRHGPIVLVDDKTLVIMACSPYGLFHQKKLIKDLKVKGAKVVTVGSIEQKNCGSDYHIALPEYIHYGVMGINFIFVPQVIAYYRAIQKGINPDLPEGLDPWINLEK